MDRTLTRTVTPGQNRPSDNGKKRATLYFTDLQIRASLSDLV